MNSFTRGLSVAVFSLGLLGVTGCGTDNDTEAEKLSKSIGDPGAANPKAKATNQPIPKTREEAGKQTLETQSQGKGKEYKGVKGR